jgi:D-aminopeptidase
MKLIHILVLACFVLPAYGAEDEQRARDLGIPFTGMPGPLNAITDVQGVTVGHATIIRDLEDGGAVRTGVTAILPRGRGSLQANVHAGWWSLNGNGEMTGTTWVEESGFLEGPVMITNTHSIGAVHEGVIRWRVAQGDADESGYYWSTPVVAETWDGYLNDINGFHVRPEHAGLALDNAQTGPVAEGSVGGGTGMTCFEFKCGIGTSSRAFEVDDTDYTLGVLVQANFGRRHELRVAGIPVGEYFPGDLIYSQVGNERPMLSSNIVVVATDAPLLPTQLRRVAKRVALGIGATGGTGHNGSGDIFIAFSTTGNDPRQETLANDQMNPVFAATVHATEEAIINALLAGRDMIGNKGNLARGINQETLLDVLRRHGRLVE